MANAIPVNSDAQQADDELKAMTPAKAPKAAPQATPTTPQVIPNDAEVPMVAGEYRKVRIAAGAIREDY